MSILRSRAFFATSRPFLPRVALFWQVAPFLAGCAFFGESRQLDYLAHTDIPHAQNGLDRLFKFLIGHSNSVDLFFWPKCISILLIIFIAR
jgi:hypothetical protein